jgi:ankyrin repeat protein
MDLTPLMSACSNGKVLGSRIAMLLIEAGADVNYVRQDDDMTALMFAAHRGTPELIQALIDHGAAVEGPPGTDQTPLMLAAREGHVEGLKVLIRNGADIHRPCKLPWAGGRTAEGLAELEKRKHAVAHLRGVRLGTIPAK